MKVISVIHFPEYGGPHNQSSQLAQPLAAAGIESITALPNGPGADRIRASGARVDIVELGRIRAVKDPRIQASMLGRFPLDLVELRRLFRRERPDVVQLNGLMNPHAAIVARSLGIPVVWQLLDTRPPMKVRKAIAPLVNRLADVVMPVGHAVAAAHPGLDLGPDRTVVFYPPVDTDRFSPVGESTLRVEFGVAADVPIVGCVANVNPQKGYETFIEAAGRVLAEIPNAVFVSAGHIYPQHGAYREALGIRASELGLVEGKNLFFLGSRSDIPNVLRACDLFVLTSVPNSEGTPTAILEAMATGLPIVASNVASVPEIVFDGENGFLVTPGDADAFAQRIVRILQDDALARSMGTRSRSLVIEQFSIDRCVDAHLRAYRMAIGLEHSHSLPNMADSPATHKTIQITYYDEEANPEFETTRPHGTPRFYQQLLTEKFRRSTAALQPIVGKTALTVCGGSGMDAEYLARAGARVIASDLSLGASRRARERFGRFLDPGAGDRTPAVTTADVEHLPFPDRSLDLVYVHDGLHHLEDPETGLREMCRVAAWAISLTEPANAALTGLAVKLGRAEAVEEAGNRVARLDLSAVTRILESEGFTVVRAQRYAMYYKHKPGWVMRLLSLPVLNSVAWLAFDAGNFLIGRWGNKLTVQAERHSSE